MKNLLGYVFAAAAAVSLSWGLPAGAATEKPALYKPLPVGVVLDYGSWKCEVVGNNGFDTTCRDGNKSVQIFGKFVVHGPLSPVDYARESPILWCESLSGGFQGEEISLGTLQLDKTARQAIKKLWPLKVGNHARFDIRHGRESTAIIKVNLRIKGVTTQAKSGHRVYEIEENRDFRACLGTSFPNSRPEFQQTILYDSNDGIVLRYERFWTAGSAEGLSDSASLALPVTFKGGGILTASLDGRSFLRDGKPVELAPRTPAKSFELSFWESVKHSTRSEDYKAYLTQYPNGRFAALARVRAKSPPPTLFRSGASATAQKPAKRDPLEGIHFGKYHALVIGNNDYQNLTPLKTAINDADSIAKLLRQDYGYNVSLIKNATRSNILGELNKMRERLETDDNLLIYYAGHGLLDEIGEQGYWLPVDAQDGNPSQWISNNDITTMIRAIRAKHVMVVADSCYSGTLVRSGARQPPTSLGKRAWIKRMLSKRTRVALVSGGLEPVIDSSGGGNKNHSVFANALIKALSDNDGVIEGQRLFDRVKRPVVLNADQTPQFSDIRRVGHDGGDFLFVKRRK